jgi:hypothetical protein
MDSVTTEATPAATAEAPATSAPSAPASAPASTPSTTQGQAIPPEFTKGAEREKERKITAKPFTPEYLEQLRDPSKRPAPAQAPQVATAAAPAYDANALLGDYYTSDEADEYELLGRLFDHDQARYERLVSAVMESHRDHFIQELRISRPTHISEEELAAIPEHLREAATQLSPAQWDELAWASSAFRVQALETVRELNERREADHKAEVERHEQSMKDAAKRADNLAKTISDEFSAKHQETIGKWAPFGEEEGKNISFRNLVMRSAQSSMDSNPESRAYVKEAHEALRLSELYQMSGDFETSNAYIEHARWVAGQWNEAFEKHLKIAQSLFNPIIADALKWREHEKKPKEPEYEWRDFKMVPKKTH